MASEEYLSEEFWTADWTFIDATKQDMDISARCRSDWRHGDLPVQDDAAAPASADIQTTKVSRETLTREVIATGVIRPVVGAEINVGSRVSGIVQNLPVKVGDRVEAGELLAQLDPTPFEALVQQATADVDLSKAVGAESGQINFQFLTETVVIALTSGLFGIGIGMIAAVAFGNLSDVPMIVTPGSLALGLGAAVLVGIFAGVMPARQASAMDPVNALR